MESYLLSSTVSKSKTINITTLSKVLIILTVVLSNIMYVNPNFAIYLNVIICSLFILFALIYFYNKKISFDILFISSISVLLIIITKDISRISTFIILILIYSTKTLNKETLAKFIFWPSIICLTIILLAYSFGFNTQFDTEIYRPFLNKTVERLSLGFTHPNQFMINWLTIVIAFFCSYKIKFFNILLVFFTTLLFYLLNQSRTVFFIITLVTIMLLFRNFKLFKNRKFINWPIFLFLLFLIGSLAVSLLFKNTKLDSFLSGRLIINYNMLSHGIFLFGNLSLEETMFDSSYIHLICTKGVLFLLAYFYIFIIYFKNKCIGYVNFVLILSILLLALTEVCLLKYNIMLCLVMLSQQNKL